MGFDLIGLQILTVEGATTTASAPSYRTVDVDSACAGSVVWAIVSVDESANAASSAAESPPPFHYLLSTSTSPTAMLTPVSGCVPFLLAPR